MVNIILFIISISISTLIPPSKPKNPQNNQYTHNNHTSSYLTNRLVLFRGIVVSLWAVG